MRVLVIGGQGFIGQVLARALLQAPGLASPGGGLRPLQALCLLDPAPAPAPTPARPGLADGRLRCVQGDGADPAVIAPLIAQGFDQVFALGATLTSEAELAFERGLQVNLLGMLHLLEACRQHTGGPGQPVVPRLVYASSIAAFGGALPDVVGDDQPRTPQTSYGTQKAINELLVNDYTRRGHVDGRSLRLPVVLARPPSALPSVSDHLAALLRDRRAGRGVVCPWRADTRLPMASVRAVVRALLALQALPGAALGPDRALNLPSLSVRLDELAAAAPHPAQGAPAAVHWQVDTALQAVVDAWPRRFDSARARALGLPGDRDLPALVADALRDLPAG